MLQMILKDDVWRTIKEVYDQLKRADPDFSRIERKVQGAFATHSPAVVERGKMLVFCLIHGMPPIDPAGNTIFVTEEGGFRCYLLEYAKRVTTLLGGPVRFST